MMLEEGQYTKNIEREKGKQTSQVVVSACCNDIEVKKCKNMFTEKSLIIFKCCCGSECMSIYSFTNVSKKGSTL